MNRFHLLTVEDEPVSIAASSSAATSTTAAVQADKPPHTDKDGKPERTTFDRRSRSGRKEAGSDKHRTVGKGSWGRPLSDSVIDENEDAVVPAAEGEEQPSTSAAVAEGPKVAFKTVQQYMAEQEEKSRRLQSLSTAVTPRKANRGNQIEVAQVVKKDESILIVGGKNKSTGNNAPAATKDTSSLSRKFTLQELNQILPPAPRRAVSSPADPPHQRAAAPADKLGASSRQSAGERSSRPRPGARENSNRSPRNDRPHGAPANQASGKTIDIHDAKSFPALTKLA